SRSGLAAHKIGEIHVFGASASQLLIPVPVSIQLTSARFSSRYTQPRRKRVPDSDCGSREILSRATGDRFRFTAEAGQDRIAEPYFQYLSRRNPRCLQQQSRK